jgi:hypothetical protein
MRCELSTALRGCTLKPDTDYRDGPFRSLNIRLVQRYMLVVAVGLRQTLLYTHSLMLEHLLGIFHTDIW